MITVWELRSPSHGQTVRVIHPWRPDDLQYEHEYQRIVYRGTREGYAP